MTLLTKMMYKVYQIEYFCHFHLEGVSEKINLTNILFSK